MEQGFVTGAPDLEQEREHRRGAGGGCGEDAGPVKFEVTDKALDFLGYRALRDLLGSIGRSDAGRHEHATSHRRRDGRRAASHMNSAIP